MSWLDAASSPSFALLGTFAVVAAWECAWPRRHGIASLASRWFNNISLTLLGSLLVRWCVPVAGVSVALLASDQHWGLMNLVQLPWWAALLAGVVALDGANYAQHRLFHALPVLWRVHQVHHSDLEFDCGTAIRHHPVESVLSTILQLASIAVLGVAPIAVLLSEVLQGAAAFFNHGNIALPGRLDRVLRSVLVTPDMHRIHHSVLHRESNSNYANLLTWWDRLFGTYAARPEVGYVDMQLGIACARSPHDVSLPKLLMLPFRRIDAADAAALVPEHPSSHIIGGAP